MTGLSTRMSPGIAVRSLVLGLVLVLAAACGEDDAGPTETIAAGLPPNPTAPGDSTLPVPTDSTMTSPDGGPSPTGDSTAIPRGDSTGVDAEGLDTRSRAPGIAFASFGMTNQQLNSVHTGWQQGGALSPSNIITQLSGARAKGGRVVIKLSKGRDYFVQNGDGTFSLEKWKALVSQYRNVNLNPFITDGTIIGHFLIDEPHRTAKWGGKIISQKTLEEMARHSKQLWPGMNTLVRVAPSWLASAPITYVHLDAGWTQYVAGKGDPARWVAAEAAAAKRKGLGLVVGLNVIDGGKGGGRPPMTASEIKSYGTAMLNEQHACAFFMWVYNSTFYNRSDVKAAMADVSARARSHVKTSCRQ